MGGERNIVITTAKIEEGALEEPPMPSLDLIVGDFQGR
jgi:hypothetical protein